MSIWLPSDLAWDDDTAPTWDAAELDTSSPYYEGLAYVYIPAAGPIDLVTRDPLTVVGATQSAGARGHGVTFSGNNAAAVYPRNAAVMKASTFTLLAMTGAKYYASGSKVIFAQRDAGGSNWAGFQYGDKGAAGASATAMSIAGYSGSYTYSAWADFGLADPNPARVVAVTKSSASAHQFYNAGQPLTTTTTASGNPLQSGSPRSEWGGFNETAASSFSHADPFFFGLAWDGRVLTADEVEDLSEHTLRKILRPRRIWVPVSAGGGTQTVTIGQATETDSALAFVAAQARAIGQASEADSAQTIASLLTVAVGQATETDSAQALQAAQSRAIAQATEADSATAIAAAQARAIAQATETDSAIAVAAAQARAVAQATETDAAQAFTAAQAMAIGQAAESDAAQPVTYAAPGSIAQAQESDSAQPIVVHHRIAIAQAAETDAAQSVAVSNGITVAIGMALEIDVGLPLAGIRLGFGQAAEIDTARTIAALLAGEHVTSQRIYIVHDELRTYAVPDEDRVYLVPDSNGTLSI